MSTMPLAAKDPFLFFKLGNSLHLVRLDSIEHEIVYKPIEVNIKSQLSNAHIIGSCNEYLCLSTTSSSSSSPQSNPNGQSNTLLIFNPFMPRRVKEFPSTSMEELSWAYGFGFDPKTHRHKVARVHYARDGASTQHLKILNVGTRQWTTLNTPYGVYIRSRTANCARGVYLNNGWIYWLGERQPTMSRVIVGLNPDEKEFKEISVPDARGCDHYLIKARGRLVLVVNDKSKNELQIWESEDCGEEEFHWRRSRFVISSFKERVMDQLQRDDERETFLRGLYNLTLYDVICLIHDKLLLQFHKGVLCYDFAVRKFVDFEVEGLANLGGNQQEFEAVVCHGSLRPLFEVADM